MQPPALGGSTAWQKSGSEWVDPFGPIWVFQGPNCPKIKLMGSPPISNLIIVLTMIFSNTFTATCFGASITSSNELLANFYRSSDEPSVMLLRTSGKLLDFATIHLASSDELRLASFWTSRICSRRTSDDRPNFRRTLELPT